ncbi:hypothetical protein RF11_06998 [Thelohanellus kitauei]|uniref:Uncharacterized protein n=1 Tax=Thelohanellus kitauei TaxID=669202 RepID=A0A0C2MUY9_THEKT|nr:hypothetical protein RF11_06998 [Thelohanellus kitauei]
MPLMWFLNIKLTTDNLFNGNDLATEALSRSFVELLHKKSDKTIDAAISRPHFVRPILEKFSKGLVVVSRNITVPIVRMINHHMNNLMKRNIPTDPFISLDYIFGNQFQLISQLSNQNSRRYVTLTINVIKFRQNNKIHFDIV